MPKSLSARTLSPPPPRKTKRRAGLGGFTLAETLITLAIIGVIAALTIPNLLQKYQEHVTVNKVKSTYAILANAYKMAIAENGPISDWGYDLSEGFKKPEVNYTLLQKLAPHMKFKKICEIGKMSECWPQNGPYETLNGSVISQLPGASAATAVLANGVSIFVYKSPQTTPQDRIGIIDIQIDPGKKDIVGKTLFLLNLEANGLTGNDYVNWILYQGNMDYLRCPEKLSSNERSCKGN